MRITAPCTLWIMAQDSSYHQEQNLLGLRMTGAEPGDWQDIRVSGQRYQLFCGDSSIISYQLKKEQVGLSETPYLNANSAMIRLLKTNLMLSFTVPTTAMQAQPSSTASPPSCQTSPPGRSSSWTSTLMQLMSFQLCG